MYVYVCIYIQQIIYIYIYICLEHGAPKGPKCVPWTHACTSEQPTDKQAPRGHALNSQRHLNRNADVSI